MSEAQVSPPQAECNHFAHYRMEPPWPDPETGKLGEYTGTCTECGFQWTRPAPILEVEATFSIRAEARIDLVAYFNALPKRAQEAYRTLDVEGLGYAEWERPSVFLTQNAEVEDLLLVQHRPFADPGDPQPVREIVDMDEVSVVVTKRAGFAAYDRWWVEEDFNLLRGQVPWLDLVHKKIEQGDELDEEDLARIPGPLDVPISFTDPEEKV